MLFFKIHIDERWDGFFGFFQSFSSFFTEFGGLFDEVVDFLLEGGGENRDPHLLHLVVIYMFYYTTELRLGNLVIAITTGQESMQCSFIDFGIIRNDSNKVVGRNVFLENLIGICDIAQSARAGY